MYMLSMWFEHAGITCLVIYLYCFATDVAFKDGKVGDYLFLGNMVYTVSDGVRD